MANRQGNSAEIALEVMTALIAEVEDQVARSDLQAQADALARLLSSETTFSAETYIREEVLRALDN